MTETSAPRYVHDCSRCVFLGGHDRFDLYFCAGSLEKTVIARDGDDGPEYSSGMAFSYGAIESLTEARRRAQSRGLMSYDLHDALHAMRANAPARERAELREQLLASPLGRALQLLARDEPAGTQAVRRYVDEQAEQFHARFPDKDLDDLKDWARAPVSRAYDWLRRLGLAYPTLQSFSNAVYGD